MSKAKRIGYGYKRHPADFEHAKCERVYFDHSGSGRVERGQLFVPGALRPGDVVVLLDARDLGAKATSAVEAAGASVEVSPLPGEPRRAGSPLIFDPTPEQRAAIRALYLNPGYTLRYLLDRAEEIMGWLFSRNMLVRAFGNRHKR